MSSHPPEENCPDFLPPQDESGQPSDNGGSVQQSPTVNNYSPTNDSYDWHYYETTGDFGRLPPRPKSPKRKWAFRPANITNPSFTYTLIILCVGVWFLQLLFGPNLTSTFDLRPLLVRFEPWRLITSAFLHSHNSILHLLMNMLALYWIGSDLEKILGHAKYLTLFLLSALGGSVLFVLLSAPNSSALGASGAIFGMFGAYAVFYKALKQNMSGILVLLLLNLSMPLFVPGIAWQAHVGGLLTGGGLTAIYLACAHRRKTVWPWVVIVTVALFGIIFIRSFV